MGHTIDLVGQRYGRLSVLSKTERRDASGNVIWKCVCDCGNVVEVRTSSLKNSHSKSCGCLNREINGERIFKDLMGQVFGYWVVIRFAGQDIRGKSMWMCECKCGKIRKVKSVSLIQGTSKSCGCYHSEIVRSHCGEKHYNWRGGYSDKDYPKEWNMGLKEFIRNRDGRKCQYPRCSYDDTKEKQKLSVHHIDGNKKNCLPINLISLCNVHHLSVENTNPEGWGDRFYAYTEDFEIR